LDSWFDETTVDIGFMPDALLQDSLKRGLPPHDPEAFASAVIRLIEDPERRRTMGLYGRRYVEARAERSLVLSSYAELIGGEDNKRPVFATPGHQR
jgi:glycosyltransferase involved in cell wall biosynthesis